MGKGRRIPNTYVILAAMIALCAIATWFVPGGQYVKGPDGSLSYEAVPAVPQTWQVFSALYHGFVKQAGIIVFILVVGGAFWLLNATGAVSAGIERFISRVGKRDKLVLAASLRRPVHLDDAGADSLFLEACRAYPDFMVTLFSTPLTGTWLTVSPEMLLDGEGDRWRTMALAGTMPLSGREWSAKNRREQALVERFVRQTLERFSTQCSQRGPESRRAGHLQHLCTVFDFRMQRERLGALLSALHPTPAVSGLERSAAVDFIRSVEACDRRYYSGFCGPTDPVEGTRLYVTLRSAAIDAQRGEATLWAGGGIMPDSRLEEEWTEVVQKMHTVNRLFDHVQ